MLFIFVPILAFILLALNLLLAPHVPYEAKVSAYECGYNAIPGQTRSTFQIQFYLVAILFLVFDLELLIFWAAAVSLDIIGLYGLIIALLFFTILTIGFIYEWNKGALNFNKKI